MRRFLAIKSSWKIALIISVLSLCFYTSSYAVEIKLQWDPLPEWDLIGYKFYFDTNSGDPYYELDFTGIECSVDGGINWYPIPDPPPIYVGKEVTEISLRNLDSNKTYYFAVTAYDDLGRESDYSNQVITFGISSPQDGFYVNASNYTSYEISGMGIASAIVEGFTDSTSLGTTIALINGTWSKNVNFTGITEGSLSLTAVSGGITSPAVTGTFDITAPGSSANSPSYASGTFSLAWTADDASSGVASTELWYKKGSGGTWANTGLTAQAGTSGTFAYSPSQVEEGTYYFATRSTDKAGNVEAEPSGEGDVYKEVSPISPGGTDKAAGEGCFISTAAYGSNMDWHVQILSEFRDRHLLTNQIGHGILDAYYKFSPPVANYLHKHPSARALVRYALIPITGLAYISLHIHPLALLFAFILLLLTGVYFFKRSAIRRQRSAV